MTRRGTLLATAAFLILSVFATPASAAVLGFGQNDETEDSITYEYRADRGERNRVEVTATRSGTVVFRDTGARRLVVRVPSCRRGRGPTVRCRYREFRDLDVDTRDRGDRIRVATSASGWFGFVSLDGSLGNDRVSLRSDFRLLLADLKGSLGNDRLFIGGQTSEDVAAMSGGPGNDRLIKRSGSALTLLGDSGNDSIDARSGASDRVNCGTGRDRLIADRRDSVTRCERVRRSR